MDKKAAVLGLQVGRLFDLWTEALGNVANLTEENASLKELVEKQAKELAEDKAPFDANDNGTVFSMALAKP